MRPACAAKVSNMSRAHLFLLFFGKIRTTVSVAEELGIQRKRLLWSFSTYLHREFQTIEQLKWRPGSWELFKREALCKIVRSLRCFWRSVLETVFTPTKVLFSSLFFHVLGLLLFVCFCPLNQWMLLEHLLVLLFLMLRRIVNSDRHRLSVTSFGTQLLVIYLPAVAKSADERASQPALFPSAVEFSKDLLLSTCLQTPNIWTCSLLPLWVLFDFGWYSGDGH